MEAFAVTVARIAILGAESSGKSTLAAALAARYGTLWVPEYLREFVETKQRVPFEADQVGIARTQLAREDEASARATRLLFCDTTPFMTALYSRFYWHRVDEELAQLAAQHNYAATFVAAPDTPWVPDGLQRESAEIRDYVHRQVIAALDARGIPFTLLHGDVEARVEQAALVLAQFTAD
ncbi:MAG TPA: ATP-binding protein [Telluria sp.]|nr:ATP-binding protein [Telluria sp.]